MQGLDEEEGYGAFELDSGRGHRGLGGQENRAWNGPCPLYRHHPLRGGGRFLGQLLYGCPRRHRGEGLQPLVRTGGDGGRPRSVVPLRLDHQTDSLSHEREGDTRRSYVRKEGTSDPRVTSETSRFEV